MYTVKFKLVASSESEIALVLHWKFRLFFAMLSLLVLAALFLGYLEGVSKIYTIIAAGGCIGGIFFHETWRFDQKEGRVIRERGLLFWYNTLSIETDQIESIHVEIPGKKRYREGTPKAERLIQSRYFKLMVVLMNRKRVLVETLSISHLYLLEEHAQKISDFIGCDLTTDVPDISIGLKI